MKRREGQAQWGGGSSPVVSRLLTAACLVPPGRGLMVPGLRRGVIRGEGRGDVGEGRGDGLGDDLGARGERGVARGVRAGERAGERAGDALVDIVDALASAPRRSFLLSSW